MVTAVVTCFNYGRFLAEAVESVRSQGARVVVVDDGSTDPGTLRALDELPGEVEVIRQENRGASAARNTGLARAETSFVLALDADDRLAPGALEALRAALDAAPEAAFAYGHQRFFGDMEGEMRLPPYDPFKLLHRHLIGPTALMRRELIEATGGYDEELAWFEDWELWVNALAHGLHGVRVDQVTHEYRRHGEGKLLRDRRVYRQARSYIMRKHRALYDDERRLAEQSDLGPLGRLVYRGFWGPRPLPAAFEAAVHRLLWRRADPAR